MAEAQRFAVESAGRRIRKLLEEQDVTARIIQLVYDTYGPSALPEAWDEFSCSESDSDIAALLEFTADSPFLEYFTSWLAHTWTPATLADKSKVPTGSHRVPTQTFLARYPDLSPLLANYLKACMETPFSFFEVVSREAGRRFTSRDLICGTQHLVRERAASTLLRAHQILYARIVEVEGAAVLDAAAPWALPEDLRPAILALRAEILEHSSRGVEPADARQCLLAHESDFRSFYWGFVEQAFKEDSLRPQVGYNYSLHQAAERLLMTRAPEMTAAENNTENEHLLAIPEVRQQVVRMFTDLYENWVNERLPVLGNKTALEAAATPEGQLKVVALLAEIESDLSLLPFSLDPQVFRRVRERLGVPIKGLN